MSWSLFTNENIKIFKLHKYLLKKDNQLLILIKTERDKIKKFIREHPTIDYNIIKFNENQIKENDKKIKSYSNTKWVDKKTVQLDIINLDVTYCVKWKTLSIQNNSCSMCNNNSIIIKTTQSVIKPILERIKYIIYILEYLKFKSKNITRNFNIYLVLTQLKKVFPNKDTVLNVINVNSGYTDFTNNIIFIWRLEEFEKVLFHETIHFFNMDCSNHNVDLISNINGPHTYFEAITDFFGIFYHLIYLSLITRKKIKKLLELELAFIKNQAMQVNEHFNLNSWAGTLPKKIYQKTPAFAYYILKYMIFDYIITNTNTNTNTTTILIDDYGKLLNDIINNGFKMCKFIKIISSRMSLLQLK
jgi:hypothetical protein